ncbi:Membrane protein involved in the export of O-antigen and teichoic acid [Micromonospora echinaurantiaca]|uniref:Membrane protein involved in the export of O-antigen and teichoic acid n=1 Tax=Micromonospora echinaurantiaca TaxID=47857 RepID=A0A1C5IQ16_9ACTN|nr:lipopolysaccharide biosynthesis protein [Micromonospora echinaurantiaca]SCG60415.1 Membrane protein involved in the export of O-antigen and teichoic acid [Micromonospora echinaurantiaca]
MTTTTRPGPVPPAGADRTAETRRSARSGAAGLAGAATSGLFGFVLAVVITRGYGTTGSGAFFAAIGVITVAAAVCTLGAETGLMWALPRQRLGAGGDAARLLPVALVPPLLVATAVAVAGVLAAGPLAPRLLGPGAAAGGLLAVTFAAVPVVAAMTLLLAALRCVRPVRAYVGVQFLLLPVARPALVGAAALTGAGLLAGMAGWLLPAAAALLVCLALVAGPLGVGRGARLRPDPADWRVFWRFALPRAASAAIDAGSMWVGVLLTSVLAGPADAGVFGAVGRYVLAGQLALQGLRVAVSPQLSRLLGQGERAAAAAVHRQLTTWGLVLSWPVYLLLAVFGVAFLDLFGAEFRAGAAAMTVLALAMLVNTGVGNVQSLLLMGGRSGLHLLATLAGLLVTVSLGLWLIPGHGATGAALAWAAGIATENLTAYGCARAVVGEPLLDAATLRAAAVTTTAVGAAAGAGVLAAGRGLPGLAVAAGLLAAGAAGSSTLPRVRRGIRVTIRQIRGRDGAAPAAGPAPASTKGRRRSSCRPSGTG